MIWHRFICIQLLSSEAVQKCLLTHSIVLSYVKVSRGLFSIHSLEPLVSDEFEFIGDADSVTSQENWFSLFFS